MAADPLSTDPLFTSPLFTKRTKGTTPDPGELTLLLLESLAADDDEAKRNKQMWRLVLFTFLEAAGPNVAFIPLRRLALKCGLFYERPEDVPLTADEELVTVTRDDAVRALIKWLRWEPEHPLTTRASRARRWGWEYGPDPIQGVDLARPAGPREEGPAMTSEASDDVMAYLEELIKPTDDRKKRNRDE